MWDAPLSLSFLQAETWRIFQKPRQILWRLLTLAARSIQMDKVISDVSETCSLESALRSDQGMMDLLLSLRQVPEQEMCRGRCQG